MNHVSVERLSIIQLQSKTKALDKVLFYKAKQPSSDRYFKHSIETSTYHLAPKALHTLALSKEVYSFVLARGSISYKPK